MQTSSAPWDDLRVLLTVSRQRSFLAAGKALGVSTSTVARRIEALEKALGRSLVQRGNAGTSIEPEALELCRLAEQMELGLEAVKRSDQTTRIEGTVRLSVGDGFEGAVTKVLCNLQFKEPGLRFELISEARLSDISRREADIGLRTMRSSSSVLIEKHLGSAYFALFAARSYVERRLPGGNLKGDSFERHDFVGYDAASTKLPQEKWLRERGAKRFVFQASSGRAIQDAALCGLGIACLPEASASTVDGLMRLDVDDALPFVPVYLVFHRDRRDAPRIKLVARSLEAAVRRALGSAP